MMSRKVVVTGLNCMSALGLDVESSWRGLLAGRNGIRRITRFNPADFATQIAAELPPEFEDYVKNYCSKRMMKQMSRATWMGYACTKAAMERDRIDVGRYDPARCGVIFGAADTGYGPEDSRDYWIFKTMLHAAPSLLCMDYQWQGPALTMSAACASSTYAIGYAVDLISSGRADMMITGGASAIVDSDHVRGFSELRAMSTCNSDPDRACKPFSLGRDGFVAGEGAAVLVLEAADEAVARGATIYAEIAGYAITNDGYNLMSPRPDAAGMRQSMLQALRSAAIAPEHVSFINAHGTSTVQNDKLETLAIKQVFGERAYQIPVSSAKSMIGHTAGACGALEAVITLLSMHDGIITPTINYCPDPELDLDYVPDRSRPHECRVAISNSFGFGGCNGSLVMRKYESTPVASVA